MKEFIFKLYENENFPIYLGAVIIVLVVAFFIVFFLGRKDKKKIEATQKLEKVEANAFSEVTTPLPAEVNAAPVVNETPKESIAPPVQNIETPDPEPSMAETVPEITPPVIETPTIVPPTVEPVSMNSLDSEKTPKNTDIPKNEEESEVIPSIEPPQGEIVNTTEISSGTKEIAMPTIEPPKEEVSVEPPIAMPNMERFDNLASSIETELNALEKQQEIAKPLINESVEPVVSVEQPVVEVPTENEHIVPPVIEAPVQEEVTPAIPEHEVTEAETKSLLTDEEEPIAKQYSTSENTTVVNNVYSSVYVPSKKEEVTVNDDTMEIELPKLKSE